MKTTYRIAKNTTYLFSGDIFKKIISFVITLITARYLGAENFGQLSFALSFVALFSIMTDFGAKVLINREITRNKGMVNKYVSNVVVLKLLSSVVMTLAILAIAKLLHYSEQTISLVGIASLLIILQSLGEPY